MQQPNQSDSDKSAEKHRIQMELIMLDSDVKRIASQRMQMEVELRRFRNEKVRIEMEYNNKESEMKRLLAEETAILNQIKSLKRKLNLMI